MGTKNWVGLLIALAVSTGSSGQSVESRSVRSKKVAVATSAANGQKLSYLCTDRPEVTATVVEIPPGGETGWHLHKVPVYAYIFDGSVTVEMGKGESHLFNKGDAIFEVQSTPHNGRNTGRKWAKMIVFYTGEQGRPNVSPTEKLSEPGVPRRH